MSWLSEFVKPKLRSLVNRKNEIPDHFWVKCSHCEQMLFHSELRKNLNVCHHCQYHLKLPLQERFELLFDDESFQTIELPEVPLDPLKFKDQKKYLDRLKEAKQKTRQSDAIQVAHGTIGGFPTVIAGLDFEFMGGSMGMAVGEGLLAASQLAILQKAPLMVICASGGARMQEGILSLMQMPRSIIAIEDLRKAGLPYITLLTNPTTGGVSASFAMLGDIAIAEPKAIIGFAGRRVIQETIRENLPDDFQTAEYLQDHGMVDMVIHRKELRHTLLQLFDHLMNKRPLNRRKTDIVKAA